MIGRLALLATEDQVLNPFGDDLLPWLVLALGAALVAGNVAALVRPPRAVREAQTDTASDGAPKHRKPGGGGRSGGRSAEPDRPPTGRAVAMIVVGAVATFWALASLISN